jgi:precorrin-6B methylase 2
MVEMFRSNPDSSCPGLEIPGWMTEGEMRWLHEQAKSMASVVEIGCLVGRSTAALLSGCAGPVYAVDSWEGDNSSALQQFRSNVGHYKNLRIFPMRSEYAAQFIGCVDMVFIDGDHTEHGLRTDFSCWLDKARVLICGHDYGHPDYPYVKETVDEFFVGKDGDYGVVDAQSIWYLFKA